MYNITNIMGCHTWFRKPKIKGKENCREYLLNYIKGWSCNENGELSKMLNFAFDNDLHDAIEFMFSEDTYENYIIYEDVKNMSDEPRIGGYPETILRSYDQYLKALKEGLPCGSDKTKIAQFYGLEGRDEWVYDRVEEFFKENPEGIIEFG